jgi:hypothetical protein
LVLDRATIAALLSHPVLCWEAMRAWAGMRRSGGLGLSRAYMQWRILTAYGDSLTATRGEDLVKYLAWRRELRAVRKWERVA